MRERDPDLGWLTLHAQEISQSLAGLSAGIDEVTRELGRARKQMADSTDAASRHQRALVRWTIILSVATIAYAVAAFLPVFLPPKVVPTTSSAWVLWTKTGGSSSWEIAQAYSNRKDCLTALDRTYKAVKGTTTLNQVEDGAFSVTTTDRTTTVAGKCLPDTIDPRGPRGK